MSLSVRFEKCSIEDCRELAIVVDGLALEDASTLTVVMARVDCEDTEFAASWGSEVHPQDPTRIAAPDNLELATGLYGLADLHVTAAGQLDEREQTSRHLSEADYGLQLVEIRSQGTPESSEETLRQRFEDIMRAREEEFAAGLGLDAGTPGAREYMVVVFVKDCLLTRTMRLGRYEVQPLGGLAAGDEVDVVQEYLRTFTADVIPDPMARDVAESKRSNHPCFVARFPLVRATSNGDAAAKADAEARVLGSVLSLHRLAYPTPFAAFVKDLANNKCQVWILGRGYGGNLVGGGISGEYPKAIRANVAKAKASERVRLYLGLYREALLEAEPGAQYFRLWSLLEVMATHDVRSGEPLLDWAGQPRTSAKGNALAIRGAEQRAFEYLRRVIAGASVDFNYRSELDQHTWDQLASIWYRHRNCMAHQGGCMPDDPAHCRVSDGTCRACRAARDEMVKKHGSSGVDAYRRALRDTVQYCLAHELA